MSEHMENKLNVGRAEPQSGIASTLKLKEKAIGASTLDPGRLKRRRTWRILLTYVIATIETPRFAISTAESPGIWKIPQIRMIHLSQYEPKRFSNP